MTKFLQEMWNYLSRDHIWQEKQKNLLPDRFFADRAKNLVNDQFLTEKAKIKKPHGHGLRAQANLPEYAI